MTATSPPLAAAETPREQLSPAAEQRFVIGLLVGYVVCIALLAVGIDQAFGLPAHPLFVHIPVVLVPLLVIATIAVLARPAWRHRFALAWGALAIVALAGTVLAAGAGDKLFDDRRFISHTLAEHKDAGETLRLVMFVFVAAILLTIVRDWRERRGRPIGGSAVGIGLSVVVLVLTVASGFFVVRAGHLGSKATWGPESREAGERGAPPPSGAGGESGGEQQGESGP